jgi:hypothetical protein
MATKKKKKPAKKRPGKKNSRKPVKRSGRSAKKNCATKKKTTRNKKKTSRPNPGKALKSKIAQMKPNTWYPTTLSGAKVKVKRTGSKLVIMPAKRRAS